MRFEEQMFPDDLLTFLTCSISLIRSTGVALYNRGGSGANEGKRTFVMADVFETMLV